MAPYHDLNVILSNATTALVEGETLQAAAVRSGEFTRESYMQIIGRKTAALFSAGARLGAELAAASPEQIEALANFGYNIGLAFQITDDILDLTADEAQLGKTAGVDLAQGKGVASVQEDGDNNSGAALKSGGDLFAELRQKALEGNRIEEARLQAQVLMQQAVSELDVLPPSVAVDDLVALARSTVERDT